MNEHVYLEFGEARKVLFWSTTCGSVMGRREEIKKDRRCS